LIASAEYCKPKLRMQNVTHFTVSITSPLDTMPRVSLQLSYIVRLLNSALSIQPLTLPWFVSYLASSILSKYKHNVVVAKSWEDTYAKAHHSHCHIRYIQIDAVYALIIAVASQ
jgi:hypothetical protein